MGFLGTPNETRRIRRRKWPVIAGCVGTVVFLVVVLISQSNLWGKRDSKITSDKERNIVGQYVGESRSWLLHIYDDGTLRLQKDSESRSDGTYQKLSEDEWLLSIDGFAFKLQASLTEEKNLYITSEHSNWDSELFYRNIVKDSSIKKIDLKEAIGKEWDEFCKDLDIEEVNFVPNLEEQSMESEELYVAFDDKDKIVMCILWDIETRYCIYGVYVWQDVQQTRDVLKQQGFHIKTDAAVSGGDTKNEEPLKYDGIIFCSKGDIDLTINLKGGKVMFVSVWWG